MHRLLSFKDFKVSKIETNEHYINQYINESLSVSMDVHKVTNNLIKDIYNSLNDLKETDNIKIDDYKSKTYVYKHKKMVTIFGKYCELDLRIINILDELDDTTFKSVSRENCFAQIERYSFAENRNPETITDIEYVLHTDIILNNMRMSDYMKSALEHELTHAFIYFKIRNNLTVGECEELDNKHKMKEVVYDFCEKYIEGCKLNPNSDYLGYGEDFYNLMYGIYSCSDEEINSFTQQAYRESKHSKSIDEIKSELKDSDLWGVICNLKKCIELLDNGYEEKYKSLRKEIGMDVLPKYSILSSLVKKCYSSAYTSYGKILMKLIDEFGEDRVEEFKYISMSEKDGPDIRKYYIL